MSTVLKSMISLAVVLGIAYVLISPLPEVDATFSGKSAFSLFILIPYAFLTLFFFIVLMHVRLTGAEVTEHGDVLDLLCIRLC